MPFRVVLTPTARNTLQELNKSDPTRARKLKKTLGKLEINPRNPELNSHPYETLQESHGGKICESYVENRTPAAFRVFWYYGPDEQTITVIAVTPILNTVKRIHTIWMSAGVYPGI